ncbi:hypothetical protein M5K25_002405 [Dendrobium thyrsiflorum]|uniref:Uncharacterized protein n=1 Tax=Dendrobium thyrsiflorum TaxID=117978 RepID=A0ABD0VN56_DENTH
MQARLVGLAHFFLGYIFTYTAFLIASTSGKFGTVHYGKKKFDSKGEEVPEIGTEILLDSSIL